MLFQHVRYRLLMSYLTVLTVILSGFAIAVRLVFVHSLTDEQISKLKTIAQAAATDVEVEHERLIVADDEVLVSSNQAVQWFDAQGMLIKQQGRYSIALPFSTKVHHQVQTAPRAIQSVTIPVLNTQTEQLIAYVRVSESMTALNNTFRRLDWGLGCGVVLSLGLSSLGSLWLTRQAMQPIEQSFRKLQQFTADASHELRSPLMAIKSNVAVALKYPDGMRASDVEKFQAIASAMTQMSALTEDLLMLARTDHRLVTQPEAVDLMALLMALIQRYQPQATAKSIDLQSSRLEAAWVLGNSVQLTRLFTNLIDNALRYTPPQGTVDIQVRRQGHTALLTVQDTGIGIAPQHLNHVFDRFWQADQSRSYQIEGFGLGLAIAQGIVRLHGGSITVTSEVGVGSCFTVRLPLHSHRPQS